MAVVAAAYVSKWTWDSNFPPWPPQPVYIYEIHADGSWTARGEGTYDAESQPYGYSLSEPISPPYIDVDRAPPEDRPQCVIAEGGSSSTDTHRLVWADLPTGVDYSSSNFYADVDPAYGGVDDYFVYLNSSETGELYLPATAVQVIDTLPTPFSGPGFPPRNLVIFARAAGSAPVSPPFWTSLTGTKETL